MFLKTLCLTLIFSSSVMAQTLHVEYGFNIFSIEVQENEVIYQKKSYKDHVTKKSCSENLFKEFVTKINRLTSRFPSSEKESGDFMVKYRFGNKTGQLRPSSTFAKRLLALPKEFDTFRLATEFRCEEKK